MIQTFYYLLNVLTNCKILGNMDFKQIAKLLLTIILIIKPFLLNACRRLMKVLSKVQCNQFSISHYRWVPFEHPRTYFFYRRSTLMRLWRNKLSLLWRKKQKSNSQKWQKCSKKSLRMGNVVKLLKQISGAIIRNKNKLNMMKAWCLMGNNVKEWFSIIKICWIT